MIGRIVITSVPQGLDGGTGFQPVLRTQGLRHSVAERLAMRAAYPHPFPFGDPRNPRVLFHRIETLGDRTIHVIGSIRDAGGSYTGRANRLAELIAIDPSETGGLPGGPAFAARAFPWLSRWAGSPRELPLGQEPVIPAVDPHDPQATGRPLRCAAWEKVTGDAGWAGELAQSFLDGRRALIWAGENVDVLELFVEAARLIPASARWRLTFNTCEIEPFPAHWRAVRPELGLVGNYEPKNELRLVLGKIRENGSRAPDHDLARLARGEKPAPSSQPASQNTQSQHSSFGGHAGSQSPDPDDAALRARLKEISDERRRRPNAGRAGGDATRLPVSHSLLAKALLLGSLAFLAGVATVIAFLAIQHPDLINRQLRSRNDEDSGLSPAVDLITAQQQERSASHTTSAEQAETAEGADRERQDGTAPVSPAPPPQIAASHEIDTAEVGNAAADKPQKTPIPEDQSAARTRAFDALNSNRSWVVPLLDDSSNNLLDDSGVELKEFVLHDQFHVVDLIDLTIDVASPYDGNDKLSCSEEPQSPANTRTWTVTGQIHQMGDMLPPKTVCSVIARDGKLFLKPAVNASHELFTRLQNSCLLISFRNPRPEGGGLVKECWIAFCNPIDVPSPYLLDPLKDNSPSLGEALTRRLDGIDPSTFEWTVELSHPSLTAPRLLTQDKPLDVLKLANPRAGAIKVEYHIIDGATLTNTGTATLQLDAEISVVFDKDGTREPPKFQLIRKFQGFSDNLMVLKNSIPIETLQRARSRAHWKPIEDIVRRHLEQQPDPFLDTLVEDIAQLNKEKAHLPQPGGINFPSTPDNRKAYSLAVTAKQTEIETKSNQIKEHQRATKKQFAKDASNAATTLSEHVRCFQPIEARIKQFEVIASDGRGRKYRIQIVKPSAD